MWLFKSVLVGILHGVILWLAASVLIRMIVKPKKMADKKWCNASDSCIKCVGKGICPHWARLEREAKFNKMRVEDFIEKYGDH